MRIVVANSLVNSSGLTIESMRTQEDGLKDNLRERKR